MKNYLKAFLFVGLGVFIGHFAPWLLTTIMVVAAVIFIKTFLDGMK